MPGRLNPPWQRDTEQSRFWSRADCIAALKLVEPPGSEKPRSAGFAFFCSRFLPVPPLQCGALQKHLPVDTNLWPDVRQLPSMLSVAPHSFAPCPCGRLSPAPQKKRGKPLALTLADCCGRYLDASVRRPAPDAEHLIRSRYSAFVLQRRDYLLATWHASTRPVVLDFESGAHWLGLEVRHHRVLGADQAEVEFVARYRVAGRAVRLHENSRFVREDGQWFYVEPVADNK